MATEAITEFSITKKRYTNTRDPFRWILSHANHYWYLIGLMILGAMGNAGLASVMPIYLGRAFNLIQSGVADPQTLLRIAIIITSSQALRSILRFRLPNIRLIIIEWYRKFSTSLG